MTIGVAVGIFVISLDGESAQSVTVRGSDGDIVSEGSLDDSLKEASKLAGFPVVAPRNNPHELQVHDILVPEADKGSPNRPPTGFGVVTLQLQIADVRFLLDELRGTFNPVISGELLNGAIEGADVYYDATDTAVIYSMLAKGRGFIMSFPVNVALDRTVAVDLLRAFANELK